MTPRQVEAFFGVAVQTLANLRAQRRGPRFRKSRTGFVTYLASDVQAWLDTRGAAK